MDSSIRRDAIRGGWVIVAPDRARRPLPSDEPAPADDPSACPFCPGRESRTPPEILAHREEGARPDSEGWRLRVVPNRYPALGEKGSRKVLGPAIRRQLDAVGVHEVIVESPRHVPSLTALEMDEVARALGVYRDRLAACRVRSSLRYGLLFKNVGTEAGASLLHTHAQVIGTPILPPAIDQEARLARRYWRERRRCVFCDVIRSDAEDGARVVRATESFIALCPFASRFPLETWILPTAHASTFERLPDFLLEPLARFLIDVLRRIERESGRPRYNLLLHTSPYHLKDEHLYHWHFEILPRLGSVAGFEWGSGLHVNPVPPEEAARRLREG